MNRSQIQSTCPSDDKDTISEYINKKKNFVTFVNKSISDSSLSSDSLSYYNTRNRSNTLFSARIGHLSRQNYGKINLTLNKKNTTSYSTKRTKRNLKLQIKNSILNLPQKRESISSRKQRRFSNVINFNENTMLYNSGKQYKVVPMLDLSGTNVNQKISRSRRQSVNSRRYSIASSIMNFSDTNRINISDDEIETESTTQRRIKHNIKVKHYFDKNWNNITNLNMTNQKFLLLQSSLDQINDKLSTVLKYQDILLPQDESLIIKKDEQVAHLEMQKLNSHYINKARRILPKKSIVSLTHYDNMLYHYCKKELNRNYIKDGIKSILYDKYFDQITYYYMLKSLSFIALKRKNIGMLSYEYCHQKTYTKTYMMIKLIMKDFPINLHQNEFNKEHFINKCKELYVNKSQPIAKKTFIKRNSVPSNFKRTYYKQRTEEAHSLLKFGEEIRFQKAKTNTDKIATFNKAYFNRGKFKVSEMDKIVEKIEMHPRQKVQDIQFHIADPHEEMKRVKDMSKESLVFRTQEIKLKMKKELTNVEQILFFLIQENNLREFKDIIDKYKVSTESRDNGGNTFLLFSVECGFFDFVKLLLQKGANIDAQNDEGNTSLHLAMKFQNFEIIDYLLKNGASESIINNNNMTPWECLQN